MTKKEQWDKSPKAVADLLYKSGHVEKEFVEQLAFDVVQEVLLICKPEMFKPDEEP